MTYNQQQSLENEGIKLWRSLLNVLHPDLVIVSIARKHLEKLEITEKWKALYTVERNNPYTVESSKLSIDDKTTATIIFGKAANTPFGTVSYYDRRKIGSLIGRYTCGKSREYAVSRSIHTSRRRAYTEKGDEKLSPWNKGKHRRNLKSKGMFGQACVIMWTVNKRVHNG